MVSATGGLGAIASLIGQYAQRLYEVAQNHPYYELRQDADQRPGEP